MVFAWGAPLHVDGVLSIDWIPDIVPVDNSFLLHGYDHSRSMLMVLVVMVAFESRAISFSIVRPYWPLVPKAWFDPKRSRPKVKNVTQDHESIATLHLKRTFSESGFISYCDHYDYHGRKDQPSSSCFLLVSCQLELIFRHYWITFSGWTFTSQTFRVYFCGQRTLISFTFSCFLIAHLWFQGTHAHNLCGGLPGPSELWLE